MVPPDDHIAKDELELISEQTILRTKLYRPPVTPDLIRRERLLEYLEGNWLRPMTLISAPAGYGKSVLARMWLEACDHPSAWVSLDEADDDPATFLSYLLAAISATFPNLQLKPHALLNAPQFPNAAVVARYLLNALDQLKTRFILALDDLHRIKDQAIYDFLAELLRHPSPVLHLLLISRQDPPLPIASLRARRKVTEIRVQSLRFTPQETAQLLHQTLRREVDEDLAGRWTEKTEGWVTALRLAALSLRQFGHDQELHSNISNDSRYLQEYLLAEILAGLPPDLQDRLLKVSILDRFCTGLIETVSGQGDRFLRWLENSNLFLIALDQGQHWFRFHHLFQQMLQNLLHNQLSEQAIAELYLRASRWFAENGLVDEAIRYALTAGDTQAAADLVIQHRYDLMNTEQWHRLDRWLKLLPEETINQNILLLGTQAHVAIYAGNDSMIYKFTQKAELLLTTLSPQAPEYNAAQGDIAAARSFLDFLTGQIDHAFAGAQSGLQRAPSQALYIRSGVIGVTLWSLQAQGHYRRCTELVRETLADPQWPAGIQAKIHFYFCITASMEGQLASVLTSGKKCLRISQELQLPQTTSFVRYILGASHYLRSEFDEAEPYLLAQWEDRFVCAPSYLSHAIFLLALIYTSQGRLTDAIRVVDHLRAYLGEIKNAFAGAVVDAFRVELALRQGNLEKAHHLSSGVDFNLRPPIWHFYVTQITPIKLLYAERTEESLNEAQARLQVLDQQMRELNRNNVRIDVLALAALVLDALGDEPAAFEQLRAALELGEPGGFIRTFVDLGPPMASLLNRLNMQALKVTKKKLPTAGFAYLTRLLAAFPEDEHSKKKAVPAPVRPDSQSVQMPVIDPLTRRELKVLKLLGAELLPNEIAVELVISLSTVRTHLKSIYSKLDVHNRAEAVQRAHDLGLV